MNISTCWFKGNCPREKKSGCKSYCSIFQEFDYLINNSNIPADYMKSKTLYPMDVDYSSFNQKLVYREGFEPTTAEDNQRGLKIVKIPVEWDGDVSRDNRFYIENHLDKCEAVDYNNY